MARKLLGNSGSRLTFWISTAASTILVFYGYDQGVFGNVIVSDDFLRIMNQPSASLQGNMTSVYNLGCFVGALSTILIGDKLGRPRVLLTGSSIIAIGGILQAASYGVPQMMVGRIVAGLGTGMNTATAGVWQSETSPMGSRGKLITIQMASCIFGVLLSNFLTLGLSFAPGSVAWRFPLAFQCVFTLLAWAMCPFLPDSPRLLIRKGRHREALEVLAALIGDGATVDSPSVQTQYRIINGILEREKAATHKWWQVLLGKGPFSVTRRMILSAWMLAMTQLSGINITSYYMTYVFVNALNFSVVRSRILSSCGSVVYLIFSSLAYFIIERWGRRRVIITSSVGCSLCWIVIALTQGLIVSDPSNSTPYNITSVVFFFIFFATFGIAEVTPIGIENLGWRFWVIWAIICASFVPIVYLFYPETANRSLEDIDRFFETKPGIFVFRNKLATQLSRPEEFSGEDDRIAADEEKKAGVVGETT
ncbi:hypothetical protein VUR80DRAFT_9258 [Thermomyces stellatus]